MKSKSQIEKPSPGERILSSLAGAESWLSGEELARCLGTSRAAVAKHVARLRDAGHVIEAATRKGYRLLVPAERCDGEAIAPHLRTRILGRRGWRWFAETASTNSEAIAWALDGAPEGAMVTAENQAGGKGRKGREWFSSPRGLHFSIVFRADGARRDADGLVEQALAAMAETVRAATGLVPEVKPPNDLLLRGAKIAGVLVEAGSRGGEPDWLVLGMGLNVNVLPEEFPAPLRERATSLYREIGGAVSKNRLLAEFLARFEKRIFGKSKEKPKNT